jgi:hypothetical protein
LAQGKIITGLMDVLGKTFDDVRQHTDDTLLELFPQTTTSLDEWDKQFGLPFVSGFAEQDRRDRLAAEWRTIGGQSPRYIQDTLQAAGFPVYIHEWWEDDTPTPRDPRLYLRAGYGDGTAITDNTMGNSNATMGSNITMSVPSPNILNGYVLVNKTYVVKTGYTQTMGNPATTMGNPDTTMGSYSSATFDRRDYSVPGDTNTWPYFLYFGGQTFGDVVEIPLARRDEFENLLLKICPTQQWLGLFVRYN